VRRAGAITAAAAVAACALAGVPAASAQGATTRARPRGEARIDYLWPHPHAVHAGVGVNIPVGPYLRVGLIGGAGTSWRDGQSRPSARADVVGRFALDPFRERRWGLSAGGGLSVRYDGTGLDRQQRWRALVAILLDLEGPRAGSIAPAVQVGLGGGWRAGVILRGAQNGFR
jgi:hypothetical protein